MTYLSNLWWLNFSQFFVMELTNEKIQTQYLSVKIDN